VVRPESPLPERAVRPVARDAYCLDFGVVFVHVDIQKPGVAQALQIVETPFVPVPRQEFREVMDEISRQFEAKPGVFRTFAARFSH
jgi:hypothetical protein